MQRICSHWCHGYTVTAWLIGAVAATAATPSLVLRGVFPDAAGDVIEEVKVVGSHAYLANGGAGFRILEVSDPSAPQLIASLPLADGGLARGVAVDGNLAYVADWFTGLYRIDISDPAHPTVTGHSEGVLFIDVETLHGYAYVCEYSQGLAVFNVLDPTGPVRISQGSSLRANALAMRGECAYVAAIGGGMVTFDVGNPIIPAQINQFQSSDYYIHEVAVAGDYAYTVEIKSAEEQRLNIIDVSDVRMPQSVGHLEVASAYYLAVSGDFVVIGDEGGKLALVNVGDPENPRLVSTYHSNHQGLSTGSRRPCFAGGLVYWPNGKNGLKILSIEESPDLKISGGASPESVQIDWERLPDARLQRSTNLLTPNWEDVSESGLAGEGVLTPTAGPACFFRVVRDIR